MEPVNVIDLWSLAFGNTLCIIFVGTEDNNSGVHHRAGKVPAFCFLAGKGILKLFIDESGDPGVFSAHSPIYTVGFVALEPGVDLSDSERRFRERISRLNGGEYFVHVGNIIRNEKPYKEVSPENRRKLFWNLFFFAMHSPIRISSVHCRKEGMNEENLPSSLNVRFGRELRAWAIQRLGYLKSFEKILVYYDYGQSLVDPLITGVLLALGIDVEFVKCRQDDAVLLQVADMACELELIKFKYSEGSFTHSEQEFFGLRGKLKKDFLIPLKKKMF
ncbi:MAG: DUF3800 domain-containing protein [Bacilli bacterium]|nr:DUF3800 domain-containing protein [Bacilli bacterium]